MILWIKSYQATEAATLAAILNQMSTFVIVILATLVLKERLDTKKVLAVCLGFAAAALAVWSDGSVV